MGRGRRSGHVGLLHLTIEVSLSHYERKSSAASERECGTRGPDPWLLRYQISPGGRYEG